MLKKRRVYVCLLLIAMVLMCGCGKSKKNPAETSTLPKEVVESEPDSNKVITVNNSEQEDAKKGKKISVEKKDKRIVRVDSQRWLGSTISMGTSAEYDEKNRVTKETILNYTKDGEEWCITPICHYDYEYDEKYGLVKITKYSEKDGCASQYEEYKCETDENGCMKKTRYCYQEEGVRETKSVTIPEESTKKDFEYYEVFSYDRDGNLINRTSYYEDGAVEYTYNYEYDSMGNKTKEAYYRNGTDDHIYVYEYDGDFNLVRETTTRFYNGKEFTTTTEFNKEGYVVKRIDVSAGGIETIENPEEKLQYDEAGRVICYKEGLTSRNYVYDEDGYLVEENYFNPTANSYDKVTTQYYYQ